MNVSGMTVGAEALPDPGEARERFLARVEPVWLSLTGAGACDYFLSWGWIGTWLRTLPAGSKVWFVRAGDGGRTICVFFAGERRVRRRGFFASRSLFLNATGIPDLDAICIEYNGMPVSSGEVPPLSDVLSALPPEWEEFQMPALAADAFPGNSLGRAARGYRLVTDRRGTAFFADLEQVRRAGDYLALLSANTRAQVRQSLRRCAALGPISVRAAAGAAEALGFFRALVALHALSWAGRNDPGAFGGAYMRRFHETLIEQRFGRGEIALLRVAAGDTVLGWLYGFRHGGRFLYYQSGINPRLDPRCRPGIVCHCEAIRLFAAEEGCRAYDFLAGASRYKRSLATGSRELVWCRLQKPRLRFRVEEALVGTKRRLAGAARAGTERP